MSKEATQAKPNIIIKGTEEFRHDLFKLKLANAKKNVSWKKNDPQIVEVEHTHFFHSHSNRGNPNKFSVQISGHFHEVSVSVDKQGNFKAECSGPKRKVIKAMPNGKTRTIIEDIAFYDGNNDRKIFDTHTHEVQYIHSEYITEEAKKLQLMADTQKLSNLTGAAPRPTATTKAQPAETPDFTEVPEA